MTSNRVIELRLASELRSLSWMGDDLIDWVGGVRVSLDGEVTHFGVGANYRFDNAVGCDHIGVVFETLGTKGVLRRWNGELPRGNYVPLGIDVLREIDRSFYQAEAYAFPVCVFRARDERILVAGCPRGYDCLDLELPDGTQLTHRPKKNVDVFHSRLEASLDGRWLLSHGWVWHPLNVVCVYDVERALAEPAHLSTTGLELDLPEPDDAEVEAACLGYDCLIVVTNGDASTLAVLDLPTGRCRQQVRVPEPPGSTLMAWGSHHVVAFDGHPRLLSLSTAEVVERWTQIDGGAGWRQPSANIKAPAPPWIARDPARRRFAVASVNGGESLVHVVCAT